MSRLIAWLIDREIFRLIDWLIGDWLIDWLDSVSSDFLNSCRSSVLPVLLNFFHFHYVYFAFIYSFQIFFLDGALRVLVIWLENCLSSCYSSMWFAYIRRNSFFVIPIFASALQCIIHERIASASSVDVTKDQSVAKGRKKGTERRTLWPCWHRTLNFLFRLLRFFFDCRSPPRP